MTRGELAKRADVNRETIRYYERRGLIPRPERGVSNDYRIFAPETLQRLRFIKGAQSLGFTLNEIGDLLDLRADPEIGCSDVKAKALAKVDEVDQKIRELRRMRKALTSVVDQCTGEGPLDECPILEALEG